MAKWKFYIATFGCKVNQYESQLVREAWTRHGGEEIPEPQGADYILINSCAITARAERNARNAVYKLRQLAPDAKVVLSGCAAQFYAQFKPRKNAHWAAPDVCIPQNAKADLLKGPAMLDELPASPASISACNRARPIVKIQDGCSQYCSYCIVPQTRGKPASRPAGEILEECRRLALNGYGELTLSGINLRLYKDKGDFWDLLRWLDNSLACEFRDRLRLRISSLDPSLLTSKALETIAASTLLCPHLHISLQHASPRILKLMRRGHYNVDEVSDFCDQLKKTWPIYGLGADIITGFPSENNGDLDHLLEYLDCLPLTYAHVFPYSRRQGTVAANLPEQISKSEKERRANVVRKKIDEKQMEFLKRQMLLASMKVAADAPGPARKGTGHNEYYTVCSFEWPENHGDYRELMDMKPVATGQKCLIVRPA